MNYKKEKTKNAQVLLITLLILTVIGIVIVGLVTLANRDVTQVVTSEKYETLYNNAETQVRRIVDNFGAYDKPLDNLPQTFPSECAAIQAPIIYKCTATAGTAGTTNLETVVDVTDKREVENFEVKKDRSFTMKINGYASGLNIRWDKPAAVEFTIIAQDSSRNLKVIKDVYDLTGVYEGLVGDNPYNQPNPNHTINYQVLDSGNRPQTTTINMTPGGVNGLGASDYVYYLTLTPRLKQDNSSVKFTITPTNIGSFPYQIREFISSSIDKNDTNSPLAKVITQIPLAPQMDSVFDYALISNTAINSY